MCLLYVTEEEAKQHPEFTFRVLEEFDRSIFLMMELPEDLAHAFIYLFNEAIRSMRAKKEG